MRRPLHLLILFIILLCLQPVAAQGQGIPIILLVNGNYTAYNQEPQPGFLDALTEDGGHRGLVLSPDGKRFAFNSLSPITRTALGENPVYEFGLPEDIEIMTIDSRERLNIAPQPTDAVFKGVGQSGRGLLRSLPAWSGDGSTLVWTERALEDPSGSIRLMLYDIAARQSHLIDQLPKQPDNALPRVATVDAGCVVQYTNTAGKNVLALYTSAGNSLNTLDLSTTTLVDWQMVDAPWQMVRVDAKQPDGDTSSKLIDLLSGTTRQTYGLSRLVAANAAQSDFFFYEVRDEDGSVAGYQDMEKGRTYNERLLEDVNTLALRPDGAAIAFATSVNGEPDSLSDLQILDGSESAELLSTDGRIQAVAWSPLRWQLEESLLPCDGLQPRLRRGSQAQVLPGTPNRLRAEPRTDSIQRGLLQGGTTVNVLGGPICDANLIWWLVQHQDLLGWTAEGQDETYFMQPTP